MCVCKTLQWQIQNLGLRNYEVYQHTFTVLHFSFIASFFFVLVQPTGNFPTSSSTDVSLADDPQPPSQASCNHGVPPNAPPLYTPAYYLSGEKPPPYVP